MRHAGGKPSEHVGDGNAHPADSGSPSALAGFNSDDVLIPHIPVLSGSWIMHLSQDGRGPREQMGLLGAIQVSCSWGVWSKYPWGYFGLSESNIAPAIDEVGVVGRRNANPL
jgi:hypothetical protein